MFRNLFAAAAIAAFSGASLMAQCPWNTHPITFVDNTGTPAPIAAGYAQFPNGEAYMKLASTMPSGTYYVQANDHNPNILNSRIMSLDFLVDRIFDVTNTAGVITITRNVLSTGTNLDPIVRLADGNDIIPLCPLGSPDVTTGAPACEYKVFISECYRNFDPINFPYGNPLGPTNINQTTNTCCVASFGFMQIGAGTPATVSGTVFLDSNSNGVRDAGEPGVPGCVVELTYLKTSANTSQTTDLNGDYTFSNVVGGDYSIALLGGAATTTPSTLNITICGCAPAVVNFGKAPPTQNCNGRTPGFWSNKNGKRIIENLNLLPELVTLNVVDATGARFTSTNYNAYRDWLRGGNAVNMAYQLSRHLAAMHFNIRSGGVSASCMINDPQLGMRTIGSVVADAILSLLSDPYTPSGHPQRNYQEELKNALDRANNNLTWM